MFADILTYESRWNFENRDIIQFDNLYENQTWQIFSAYRTNVDFDYIQTDFSSDEEYMQFLETIQSESLHKTDIVLSKHDKILTLSTCSNRNSVHRFTVHAVLVKN